MTDLVEFYKSYWGVDLTKMLGSALELKPDLERLMEMVMKSYDELHNDDLFGPEKKAPTKRSEACRWCGGDIYERPSNGGCYC